MPSGLFIQTYQLYKKQTDQIAQWLLDTAEQCGYQLETQASARTNTKSTIANTPPTSGRLKGRSRKEARDRLNAKRLSQTPSPAAAEAPVALPPGARGEVRSSHEQVSRSPPAAGARADRPALAS